MSLRPEPLPPIPDVTAAAVRAAFPKGNLYVDLRAEFGTLYTDQLFADLYPPEGRPVEVAPWRLALVIVMQYMEGLTDRQAADAVRRHMALHLLRREAGHKRGIKARRKRAGWERDDLFQVVPGEAKCASPEGGARCAE